MNPQSTSASASGLAFTTNENKALLWSVLHGGGKFTGIQDKHLHNIQEMFEVTIREMSEHYRRLNQPTDLNTMNKEAVVVICKKIEIVKQQSQPQQLQHQFPHQNTHLNQNRQKKQLQIPQLETIYRAEDLQKQRQNAFQNEFKKKEEEMSSILKLKKPEEINFTDDVYDKPIGDDMERLLAETLASRERELEQIKNVSFTNSQSLPPQPMPTSTSTSASASQNSNFGQEVIHYKTFKGDKEKDVNNKNIGNVYEKRVSFGKELHIIENGENHNHNDNDNEIIENGEENGDISFIFNKLKKIKPRNHEDEHDGKNISDVNINQNNKNNDTRIILELSEDVKYIKSTLAELMQKINKLYPGEEIR